MDNLVPILVTIEFRGIVGELPIGSVLSVESCEAGVLRMRLVAMPEAAPEAGTPIVGTANENEVPNVDA
jgi:hypothetical protein